VGSIDVFGGCIDEHSTRSKMFNYIGSAFGIYPEGKISSVRVFIEIGGQVDDRIVVSYRLDVRIVENVMTRAPRKIIGRQESAHMGAEISAATGN
jgi:hypothetical protein